MLVPAEVGAVPPSCPFLRGIERAKQMLVCSQIIEAKNHTDKKSYLTVFAYGLIGSGACIIWDSGQRTIGAASFTVTGIISYGCPFYTLTCTVTIAAVTTDVGGVDHRAGVDIVTTLLSNKRDCCVKASTFGRATQTTNQAVGGTYTSVVCSAAAFFNGAPLNRRATTGATAFTNVAGHGTLATVTCSASTISNGVLFSTGAGSHSRAAVLRN